MFDDGPGQHDPCPHSHSKDGRHDTRSHRPPARGKYVTNDPERQWEDCPTGALHDPAGQHLWEVVASALISVPRESETSTMTIIFSLPTMSPIRPRIGVAIAALSR